jgi:hypothetical protein
MALGGERRGSSAADRQGRTAAWIEGGFGNGHWRIIHPRAYPMPARASFQAQWLNVHVDFPLLQRIALPITIGPVRYPGIKIHETPIIRLTEVLLHGGTRVGGWTAEEIHQAILKPRLWSQPAAFTICASSVAA